MQKEAAYFYCENEASIFDAKIQVNLCGETCKFASENILGRRRTK